MKRGGGVASSGNKCTELRSCDDSPGTLQEVIYVLVQSSTDQRRGRATWSWMLVGVQSVASSPMYPM